MRQGCGSWKRLNFCGSGRTLKKEAGSGSKKYSTASTSLLEYSHFIPLPKSELWNLSIIRNKT